MGALADCERVAGSLIGQPVNTLTTLVLVLAGLYVMAKRPVARWIGAGLVVTGVGSFLFHGPMPAGAEWAHDVTLAWLITLVAGYATPFERYSKLPALLVLGVVFALVPRAADPLAVAVTGVAVFSLLRRDRSYRTWGPLLLLGGAAILGRLGATGGPLCDPESLFQWHGVWHVASAVAVAWWALATDSPREEPAELAGLN